VKPPFIYWEFSGTILPPTCRISQEDSDTGDRCHHVIYQLKGKPAERLFPKNLDAFNICDQENNTRILTLEDMLPIPTPDLAIAK
jgi:hypothetical protein